MMRVCYWENLLLRKSEMYAIVIVDIHIVIYICWIMRFNFSNSEISREQSIIAFFYSDMFKKYN